MITYNHERFIARAIESILEQMTDFDCELVIGDDCSTDGTRDIVQGYEKKYPSKIHALIRDKNIGPSRNAIDTFLSCHGRYVATLEGDDYWIDPRKLQKQVNALESHPECTICGHLAEVVNAKGERLYIYGPSPILHGKKDIYGIEDVLRSNFMHTSSLMVRNHTVPRFPAWYKDCLTADFVFQILHAIHGNSCFLHEIMSAYNHNSASIWSNKNTIYKAMGAIAAYRQVDALLNYKYHAIVKNVIADWYNQCAYCYLDRHKRLPAMLCMMRSFAYAPFDRYRNRKPSSYIAMLLSIASPSLYGIAAKARGRTRMAESGNADD